MNQKLFARAEQPTGSSSADTYGWDSVFAIYFDGANAAIKASWSTIDNNAKHIVQSADDDDSYKIDATFGPWQLTPGGDGKNVRMQCPITSGTYFTKEKNYPLAGVDVFIEVGMEWIPNPDQFAFVMSGNTLIDTIRASLDGNQIPSQLKDEFSNKGKKLSDKSTAQLIKKNKNGKGVEWIISDDHINFYLFYQEDKEKSKDEFINVYQYEKSWEVNLKIIQDEIIDGEPAILIFNITHNPTEGIAATVLPELFSIWFNKNVGEFNHVFSSLNLDPIISKSPQFSWLSPIEASYAVIDNGPTDSSIFSVLSMTTQNISAASHQVSPNAIPSGADAGFLISSRLFVKNMLLVGARALFKGSKDDDFLITNDGLTVINDKDLLLGKFEMDEKKQGTINAKSFPDELDDSKISQDLRDDLAEIFFVSDQYKVDVIVSGEQWLLSKGDNSSEYILHLTKKTIDVYISTEIKIQRGGFEITLQDNSAEIKFIDLTYSANSDFNVHINYTENLKLTLQKKGNKNILWFDPITNPKLDVTVTKTDSAINRLTIEAGVGAGLALLFAIGPIGYSCIARCVANAEIAETSENSVRAFLNEGLLAPTDDGVAAALAEEVVAAMAQRSEGMLTSIGTALNAPRWMVVAALASITALIVTFDEKVINRHLENMAHKQWDKLPGFDEFAQSIINPYAFPQIDGFDLVSAQIAGSLQIGFKTKYSNQSIHQ
ncbi:TULIP family P47-like protein [Burkholderia alba]|uniref:TULIP family P47-like protein n=1 Tax=Burkholderia alba TaxID=2683677 RepID=UPI002B056B8D|nr:TULIP family P47-like protein [Burkholderia alba]